MSGPNPAPYPVDNDAAPALVMLYVRDRGTGSLHLVEQATPAELACGRPYSSGLDAVTSADAGALGATWCPDCYSYREHLRATLTGESIRRAVAAGLRQPPSAADAARARARQRELEREAADRRAAADRASGFEGWR